MSAALGNIPDLDKLITAVMERSRWSHSPMHGVQHWQAVTFAGLCLASATPEADRLVVFLFGLLHDAQRVNDWNDAQHGPRAAALARELQGVGYFTLAPDALGLLCFACAEHDRGTISDDPTVGCCWDADRLNLWRLGIQPDLALLATQAARSIAMQARDLHSRAYTWHELYEGVQ